MIQEPTNLTDEDRNQIWRFWSLLDAFAAVKYGGDNSVSLDMHEQRNCPLLAYAVASWCERNKVRIETHITNANHRTYETWNISLHPGELSVWPTKMGLLGDGKSELQRRVEQIQKEADERIQQLIEQSAVQP